MNKAISIVNKLGLENAGVVDDIESVYRIGKKAENDGENEVNDRRRIMLQFKSKDTKFKILNCAKKLKNWKEDKEDFLGKGNIFINLDESPMTRK